MIFQEFKLLTREQQCDLIWEEGVYLSWRMEKGITLNLYCVFDFYVEIAFDLVYNQLLYLRPFKDIHSLDLYLIDVILPIEK